MNHEVPTRETRGSHSVRTESTRGLHGTDTRFTRRLRQGDEYFTPSGIFVRKTVQLLCRCRALHVSHSFKSFFHRPSTVLPPSFHHPSSVLPPSSYRAIRVEFFSAKCYTNRTNITRLRLEAYSTAVRIFLTVFLPCCPTRIARKSCAAEHCRVIR